MTNITTGYCTNVHAGANFPEMQGNLAEHALQVKEILQTETLGLGLWLSADAAASLSGEPALLARFANWLAQSGLLPFTFNGFPYGNFHEKVVKHNVYQPTWAEEERETYTTNLISLLHRLLPPGQVGSISTLPIGWPPAADEFLSQAATRLTRTAESLAELEEKTGRRIVLALEPEPGCVFSVSQDLVDYFQRWLLSGTAAEVARSQRYLTVCHDICHAAVMFEPQAEVISRYEQAGICVGKVQVSSAIQLDLSKKDLEEKRELLGELHRFTEDRYLHQTAWKTTPETFHFAEDLPQALAEIEPQLEEVSDIRVHFHVPINGETAGTLGTSQTEIKELLAIPDFCETGHFEVETYAWNVLPEQLQPETLATGIAEEIRWLHEQLAETDQ